MKNISLVRPANGDAGPLDNATANFQQTLRTAIFGAVTEADIVEIVRNQVKLAKDGDKNAIRFVMEYVVGGKGPQTVISKQILVDQRRMPRATKARQGTPEKLSVFEERARCGRELFNPADGEEEG